ncbi:hypothetical protein ANANG_G00046360 [Anguilla anguilla]|uniref:Uncharacterized protein n=1 Tax=Anguilla anguilla TaxID=7936 RepID=A0A9D3MUX5_ANGAN|nr:hypothetical protein ANANG_G00046360 [Anguilla anguilla]
MHTEADYINQMATVIALCVPACHLVLVGHQPAPFGQFTSPASQLQCTQVSNQVRYAEAD